MRPAVSGQTRLPSSRAIRAAAGRKSSINLYNFHPGSHVGQGTEKGIQLIAQQLNDVLTPDQQTTVLLETMAGKGTEVGRTFEELRAIIDRVEHDDKLGVCLDTCHVWDGGYDIREHLDEVLTEFDRVIGLPHLRAISNSMHSCASSAIRPSRICPSSSKRRTMPPATRVKLPCCAKRRNNIPTNEKTDPSMGQFFCIMASYYHGWKRKV